MSKKKNNSFCKKNIGFLHYIHNLPLSKRKKIITKFASKSEINSIVEVFWNFLNSKIHCQKNIIKALSNKKTYFNQIINKKNSIAFKRKKLTSKRGGFILQTLLGLALPVIKKIFFE